MIFYFVYKLAQALIMALPLKVAYRFGIFISDLHYVFANKDRANVMANLEAIFPDKDEKELKKIRLSMFRNFAKYLVDFLRFEKLNKESFSDYIHLEGLNYVDEALKKGRGAIILSAHTGNWELGGVAMALAGYSIGAVVLPHRHKAVDHFFNSQRESRGLKVIPLGRAVRDCITLLHENKLLALLGDRGFGDRGIIVDFFGKPTLLPRGPAALAIREGTPLVLAFTLRNEDDTCVLKFEKIIDFSPSGDKEADIKALVEEYKVAIENVVRKNPDQWFMFPRFWLP